ncbi:MAG: DUF1080 domain-containing protein [Acidobacteria bacterium]|nr:DUF1080 domain-containing protein [Acidobacteriota bacterium]
MNFRRTPLAVEIPLLLLLAASFTQSTKAENSSPEAVRPFLGRWDLTLKAPDREYPSWLELRVEDDQLKAQMVGRWGNSRPLPRAEIQDGKLTFVSPKGEEAAKEDMVFEGRVEGNHLVGTVNGPDGTEWTWTGDRAPLLRRARAPIWGKPVQLFDGKDLNGWRPDRENPSAAWKVEDGALVSPGHGPELIHNLKFEDFKLHLEFNCGKGANSGVYLRGRYEVQVEDNSTQEPPSHHTGGVYGFLAPSPELPRRPTQWQTFDITLVGRRVTVVQNGATVIDNQEIPGITGGALDSHEAMAGPIYLQGSEDGHIAFRNIVLTPGKK